MTGAHLTALLRKELLDLSRNRGALLPVAIVALVALLLPFGVTITIPAVTGQHLGDDSDLLRVSAAVGAHEELTRDGRVQLFLFQQFLMFFLITPITGAMALAAHSVIGEKQARTLEPLLATPVTTVELLVAKVLGALLPTLAVSTGALVIYLGAIAAVGAPGVMTGLLTGRTLVLLLLVGPTAALVSLQGALLISSRVNDARTAQQFGVFIILPLTGLLVAQFTGIVWLTTSTLTLVAAGLAVLWVCLTLLSAIVFDRESILIRWR
jgi:ABC-2 type transport system permease protein